MNIADMMKKAAGLQSAMTDLQAQLETVIVNGQAGGGMVKVTMTGKLNVKSLSIDSSLLKPEEKEILEDLVLTAFADAKAKAEAEASRQMQSLTAGLPLPPGFKLPF